MRGPDVFLISFISPIECGKNNEGLSLSKEYLFKKIIGCIFIFLSGKERKLCYLRLSRLVEALIFHNWIQ